MNILIAGVGGQGTLLASKVLGRYAVLCGKDCKLSEVHGMSQRGGDVQSNLRISSEPIASDLIPLGKADLVISLEPMEVLRYLPYLKPGGWLITNSTPFVNIDNYPDLEAVIAAIRATGHAVVLDVDALAKEAGSARAANMVLLGAASPFLGLEVDKMEESVRQVFLRKGETVADMNVKAFRAGLEAANSAHGIHG